MKAMSVNGGFRAVGVFLMLSCALTARAQKPDFTGTWQHLDSAQGSSRVMQVVHHDPALEVSEVTQFQNFRLSGWGKDQATYATDGGERALKGNADIERWETVTWSGPVLVFLTVEKKGYRVTVKRKAWTLSDDGKTLTVTTRVINMDGVTESFLSYQKQ
jgi:hypothetical protein